MNPLGEERYCLACHKLMGRSPTVCEKCGANQEVARAAWQQRLNAPPERGRFGRPKREVPLPLNVIDPVPCPTCHVTVPAGAPSCPYCLHSMIPDLERPPLDVTHVRKFLLGSYGLAGLSVVLALAGWGPLGLVIDLPAVGLAVLAHGEDPLGWGGTFAIAVSAGAFFLTMMITMIKARYG